MTTCSSILSLLVALSPLTMEQIVKVLNIFIIFIPGTLTSIQISSVVYLHFVGRVFLF